MYIYFDPRVKGSFKYDELEFEYEPFYIGKGKRDRMYDHLKYTYRSLKVNKIKAIRKQNLEPIIVKYQSNLSNEESFLLEIELIKKIGKKKTNEGPLTNITVGGPNPILFGDENGFYGKKRTEEHNKKLVAGYNIHLIKLNDEIYKKEISYKIKKGLDNINYNHSTFKNKFHSDKTKEKMRIKAKERIGNKNSQFGTMWITNGVENKKIKKEESIPENWYKGRK